MDVRFPLEPFCSDKAFQMGFYELGSQCVGCQYFQEVYHINSSIIPEALKTNFCNPKVTEYPLPLYKCGHCNRRLLDFAFAYTVIICSLTVILNAWAILVWLSVRRKRPQIYFKLSLTISDFLFGAIVLPESIIHLIEAMYIGKEEYYAFYKYTDPLEDDKQAYTKGWEVLYATSHINFFAAVLYISQVASLCSILFLNIDRYIAIAFSLRYRSLMTKTKALVFLAGMWAIIITLAMVTTFEIGNFVVRPFGMFLPIVEQVEESSQTSLYIILVYVLPLAIIFFANVVISGLTAYEISKLKTPSCYSSSSSTSKSLKRNTSSNLTTSWNTEIFKLRTQDNLPSKNPSQIPYNNEGIEMLQMKRITDRLPSSVHNESSSLPIVQKDNSSFTEIGKKKSDGIIAEETARASVDLIETVPIKGNSIVKESETFPNIKVTCRRNEHRAANRTLMIILFIYTLCVLPLTLMLILYLGDNELKYEDNHHNLSVGFTATVVVFMTSSLWNCLIYNVRNREFKATGKKLIKKMMSFLK